MLFHSLSFSHSYTCSGPTEFIFATVGNNWPEFNDDISNEVKEEVDDSTAPEQQPRRTWNPIRRVGNLIRRIL